MATIWQQLLFYFSEQQKIVSEIETIETQITNLKQQIFKISQEKEAVLRRYL